MALILKPYGTSLHFKPSSELQMITVEGAHCKNLKDLHKEFSYAFRFPEYYGVSMDALFDCLIDLSWLEGNSIMVLIRNSEFICCDENSEIRSRFYLLVSDLLNEYASGIMDRTLYVLADPQFLERIKVKN